MAPPHRPEEVHAVYKTVTLLPAQDGPAIPPRFQWTTRLLANEAAGRNARLRVRPRLADARWDGNHDVAMRLAHHLVDNAVKHGGLQLSDDVPLRLTLCHDHEDLVIEVDDALPDFPDFEAKLAAAPGGTGLGWVKHYRALMSWDKRKDDDGRVVGKTVQVLVPLRWPEENA
jgi:anti-sigma regulatory factor (Ser/Thr protein kinase)